MYFYKLVITIINKLYKKNILNFEAFSFKSITINLINKILLKWLFNKYLIIPLKLIKKLILAKNWRKHNLFWLPNTTKEEEKTWIWLNVKVQKTCAII